jgi:hypothetical protein
VDDPNSPLDVGFRGESPTSLAHRLEKNGRSSRNMAGLTFMEQATEPDTAGRAKVHARAARRWGPGCSFLPSFWSSASIVRRMVG